MVTLNEKFGFIDGTGTEVVPPRYDMAVFFSEGFAAVCEGQFPDDKWGFIDKAGQEVIPLKYDFTEIFSEGLAAVSVGGKYGVIDKTGQEVVPPKYDGMAFQFTEGLIGVCMGEYPDRKWGFIDKAGQEVIPLQYDGVNDFSEGLAAVELDGKWGFINKAGTEVISPSYDSVNSFSEGLVTVELNGKWGFIDNAGTEVIPPKYDYADIFFNGFAAVELNGKKGLIDKTGREVVPLQYDWVDRVSEEGLIAVNMGEKCGYLAIEDADAPTPTPTPAPEPVAFVDVQPNDYFYDAVQWAVENGVTSGTGDGKFSPSAKCTRAQIVTFQYRAAGSPSMSAAGFFGDVASGAYYADAVAWAAQNSITSGTGEGKFSPGNTCTRAQIVTFLYRSEK